MTQAEARDILRVYPHWRDWWGANAGWHGRAMRRKRSFREWKECAAAAGRGWRLVVRGRASTPRYDGALPR